MTQFTAWIPDETRSEGWTPHALDALSPAAAIVEAMSAWVMTPGVYGPASFRIYDDEGGALVYEMKRGPSC